MVLTVQVGCQHLCALSAEAYPTVSALSCRDVMPIAFLWETFNTYLYGSTMSYAKCNVSVLSLEMPGLSGHLYGLSNCTNALECPNDCL